MLRMGLPTRIRKGTAEANDDDYEVVAFDPANKLNAAVSMDETSGPRDCAVTSASCASQHEPTAAGGGARENRNRHGRSQQPKGTRPLAKETFDGKRSV